MGRHPPGRGASGPLAPVWFSAGGTAGAPSVNRGRGAALPPLVGQGGGALRWRETAASGDGSGAAARRRRWITKSAIMRWPCPRMGEHTTRKHG